MNASRRKMWDASRHQHYNDFRVYIMGIKGNSLIFPNGVIYEPEIEPRFYRGQSGSQDTIIPFLDCLFRVCDFYPMNELTSYLMDMREYRPAPFRELLVWTEQNSADLIVNLFDRFIISQKKTHHTSVTLAFLRLSILNQCQSQISKPRCTTITSHRALTTVLF